MSTPPLTVVCPSCSSKFFVADHIIRGKFVKFRCRKCQGTIECDGRALSVAPPQVRPASRPPGPNTEAGRTSEAPMRLSISDGINIDDGLTPALTAPKVPKLAAPPTFSLSDMQPSRPSDPFGLRPPQKSNPQLAAAPAPFTAPPTAVSHVDDVAKGPFGDTPVEAHTKSDPPLTKREGRSTGKWVGILALVAAAGAGGWFLARRAAPAVEGSSAAAEPATRTESKPASDPLKAAGGELRAAPEPPKAQEAAKAGATVNTIEPIAPTPIKGFPGSPQFAKGLAPKAAPKAEAPAAQAPAAEAPPSEPAATGPAAEAEATMAAASNEHEFNKAAARAALEEAGDRAASCRNIDSPAGAARVAVTFAPSGKVTSAVIESGPFVGTAAGGCVVSKFRNIHIPAFTSDEAVTVHKTLTF